MDNSTIRQVWNKGQVVPGYDPNKVRKDNCGAWMEFDQYGSRDSLYGWEVDHVNPNGSDYLSNLQPLQWENNTAKADGPLNCAVTAQGNTNVSVGTVAPFYSAFEGVHHINKRCPTGRRIYSQIAHRNGTSNKPLCADCRKLMASGT